MRFGKVVNVQHHPRQAAGFVPSGIGLPFQVPLFQGGGTAGGKLAQAAAQFGKHGIIVIQFHVQPAQLVQVPRQAGLK